jgi:hypothetical protein
MKTGEGLPNSIPVWRDCFNEELAAPIILEADVSSSNTNV